MPTYEYECKSCSHTFDAFQSMNDLPIKICPKCGKETRRIINGGMGVIFRGSGFYVNDKRGGSPSKEAPKPAEAASCPGCAAADSCPKAANS